MVSTPDEFAVVDGAAKVFPVNPFHFAPIEKEILTAGAMTVAIRTVTMPPGSRIVTTDRYPTLRMVEEGQLTWGFVPAGSDAEAKPKALVTLNKFGWIGWGELPADGQIVVSNSNDRPAKFVEWSVSPAQGVRP